MTGTTSSSMPAPLAQQLPGHDVGMVLQLRQEDAIARLQQRAVGIGDEIDRRRAAAGEHDLHRVDTPRNVARPRRGRSRRPPGGALGQAMDAAQHVGAAGGLVGAHRVDRPRAASAPRRRCRDNGPAGRR